MSRPTAVCHLCYPLPWSFNALDKHGDVSRILPSGYTSVKYNRFFNVGWSSRPEWS